MKEKITFPDWTRLAGQIITRNGENGKRPIWRAYDQDPAGDFLALRVTLEIAGGSTLFERFNSEEERAAAQKEASRRVTWRNALGLNSSTCSTSRRTRSATRSRARLN